jgi:DNA-binding NarL/FixJ family response regulator
MRVLIVDDHLVVRKAVRDTIKDSPEVEIVGEATDGNEALITTEQLRPDLIIMDVSMPVLDGLTAAEIIKTHYPETQILMFSMHKVQDFIDTAKRLGLSGYVQKEDGRALIDAIDAVRHHQTYFTNK